MLACLQRLTLALWLAAVVTCLLYFGFNTLAVAGALAMLLVYPAVLGLEFVLLRSVSKADACASPATALHIPLATNRELISAWWGELCSSARIFFWHQPFRAAAIPDQLGPAERFAGQRGVVFVHGFFCNRGFWTTWLKRLRNGPHAFVAVSLEPVFGSIDVYAVQIEAAVQQVTEASGLPPLVVCHSMGGLAVRAWLQQQASIRVHHVVTIGTPHRGTWLARFGHSLNNRQMRPRSDWLVQLERACLARAAVPSSLFTCWYSNGDNMVFPASYATLPGAENRFAPSAGHIQLAFEAVVMDATLALLDERTH